MRPVRSQDGFTLLELLVAVAIFAIMAGIIYIALATILDARAEVDRIAVDLKQLQRSMQVMERDLAHGVDRPVRDLLGDRQPAFVAVPGSGALFSLSRDGWPNPAAAQRSELLRVSYRLDGDRLYRLSWPRLDGVTEDTAQTAVLLEGIEDVELRFLDAENQWQTAWPRADSQSQTALPRGVELRFDHPRWGRIQRLFLVGA